MGGTHVTLHRDSTVLKSVFGASLYCCWISGLFGLIASVVMFCCRGDVDDEDDVNTAIYEKNILVEKRKIGQRLLTNFLLFTRIRAMLCIIATRVR